MSSVGEMTRSCIEKIAACKHAPHRVGFRKAFCEACGAVTVNDGETWTAPFLVRDLLNVERDERAAKRTPQRTDFKHEGVTICSTAQSLGQQHAHVGVISCSHGHVHMVMTDDAPNSSGLVRGHVKSMLPETAISIAAGLVRVANSIIEGRS